MIQCTLPGAGDSEPLPKKPSEALSQRPMVTDVLPAEKVLKSCRVPPTITGESPLCEAAYAR
jgi:hypothetical protein